MKMYPFFLFLTLLLLNHYCSILSLFPGKNMNKRSIQNHDLSVGAGLATIVLCAAFGANSVAIKLGFTGLGVFTSAGLRFLIAAAAIWCWAAVTGRKIIVEKEKYSKLMITSLVFTGQLALYNLGLSKIEASRGTLIANLQPFMVLILAHFFIPGDRMTVRKTLGMVMGFTGLLFVVIDRGRITNGTVQPGDIIVLAGTVLWACNTIYIKTYIHDYEPYQLAFYTSLVSAPFLLAGGYIWDAKMIFMIDRVVAASLLYQGIVTASIGFVIWNSLLQKYGAVALHSFTFIMPVAGVLLGGLILHEPITPRIITALLFIAAGILVVHFRAKNLSVFPLRRGNL